jgi:hypothetical protein
MFAKCCSYSGNSAFIANRDVSIQSFESQPPGGYNHSQWSRHGFGLDLTNRGLDDTKVTWRCAGASRVHELLPRIHLEIRQGVPLTELLENSETSRGKKSVG